MIFLKNIVGHLGLRKSLQLLMLCPALALGIILGVNIYDQIIEHKEKEQFHQSYVTAYNYQRLGIYSYATSGFIELWKHGPEMDSVSHLTTDTEAALYQITGNLIEQSKLPKGAKSPDLDFVLSIIHPQIESVNYAKDIKPLTDRFLTIEKDLHELSNPFIQSGNIINNLLSNKPFSDTWAHSLYLEKVLVKLSMGRLLEGYRKNEGNIRETSEYQGWIWNHDLIKNQLADDFQYIDRHWEKATWFKEVKDNLKNVGLLSAFDEAKGNHGRFSHRDFETISAHIFDQVPAGCEIEKQQLESEIKEWLMQSRIEVIRQILLLVFFTFLIFAILECGIKAISDPIRELTDKTNQFADGEEVGELPDLGQHDMGRLCRAIQSLEDTVEHFSNSLDAHSHRIQSGELIQPLEPEAYQGEWQKIAETMVSNIAGFSKLEETLKDETNDRLKLERSLHDSQKDELVIRFVEGVSGDFQTLLDTFVKDSQLTESSSEITSEDRIALQQINQAGINARRLVARLMAAAGVSDYQNRDIQLHSLLKSVHTKCSQLNWRETELDFRVETKDLTISIDPESFEEVLLNLIENAHFACSSSKPGKVSVIIRKDCDRLKISVVDNGTGIPIEDQPSICDPFFTTREREGFGGLGLTMAKSLAEKSDGELKIHSTPEKGTEVCMILNCIKDDTSAVGLSR